MKPEVWIALPSASHAGAVMTQALWSKMGYRTAFLLNGPARSIPLDAADIVVRCEYPGWGNAINRLCQLIDAEIVVGIGDDMLPDPRYTAAQVREQFVERFPDLMGVMQPTGDRWGDAGDGRGALADRICGSPWMGRAFIDRWNGGRGPFWPDYFHFFGDEEMREVTMAAGILWQRQDLTHHHDHWSRPGPSRGGGATRHRPAYMAEAHRLWDADKELFARRKAQGFPGHKPKSAGGVEM